MSKAPEPTAASASETGDRRPARAGSIGADVLWMALLVAGVLAVWHTRVDVRGNPYVMGSGDAFGYFLPAYEYEARRLAAGALPLWNPYQGAGVPFLAALQPGALYPARLLALIGSPAEAMGWSAFAHTLLALLGTYLLCRRLGAGGAAAALGAIVFATGFALPWIALASFVEPGAWLPVLALALVAILEGGGWGWVLVLGIAAGMPILAGGYQPTLYMAYGLGLLALAVVVDRRARGLPLTASAVGRLAVAAVLACATAAPQLLPTLAWSGQSVRQAQPLADVQLMTLVVDAVRQGRLMTFFFRQTSSDLCYLSLPVIALGVVGMLGRRPLGLVVGLGAIATALVTLIHPGSIFFPLYKAIPGFTMFRFPTRILLLTALFAGVAAALGLTTLTRARALGAPSRRRAVEAVALVVVVALLVWPYRNPVELPWTASSTNPLGVAFFPNHRPPPEYRVWAPSGRLELGVDVFVRQGMREQVRVLQDYEPLSARRLGVFLHAVVGRRMPPPGQAFFTGGILEDPPIEWPSLLDLVAVRTLLLPAGAVPPDGVAGWTKLEATGQLVTYRNERALPRAYVVARARFMTHEDDVLSQLIAPDFDGQREVVLVGAPAADDERAVATASPTTARPARFVVDEPEHLAVDVDGAGPGVLVVADAFAPGWEATVDGEPRRLWQANYLVRAVVLRAGDQRVELRYRAPGLAPGLALAAAGWGTVLVGLAVRRRRARAT